MIAEQMEAAKEFNKTVSADKKINMTEEKAFDEVVCDACQRMLLDTNAGQKLAEFGAQSKENKSFLDDLKRWITELLEKLRSYFKNAEPDSLAAQELAKFDANVKQILADMYVDMSIDAGEKLSTIKAAVKKSQAENSQEEKSYSLPKDASSPSYEELVAKDLISVIDIGQNEKSLSYAELKKMVLKDARERKVFDIPHPNRDTRVMIFLTEQSFTHAFSNLTSTFGEDTILAMGHIPEIIQEAVLTHIASPKNPRKAESRVFTFFAAIEGKNGIEPVKLTVKEYVDRKLSEIPQNIRRYFEENGVQGTHNRLYDAEVLEVIAIESTKKESGASASVASRKRLGAKGTPNSIIKIADLLGLVNGDAKKYIPLPSNDDAGREDTVLDKLPVGEDTSPRALLANAFESIITNDIEKRRLEEYKGKMEMLYAEEEKLRELRAQIKELSFAKGKRDTKRIKDLQFEANKTANRIAVLDGILLRLATEQGYDSIGWTTADIQSERWSDEYAEGYRIEYDQDIPKFLKKYGKQWGAEVYKTDIQTKELSRKQEANIRQIAEILEDGESFIQHERGIKEVWSMDITDSMKESVLYEGQVMYSLPKIKEDMTDTERYEILKDATISVKHDDGSAAHIDKINSLAELGDKAKSKAEKIIIPLAKDLGILNKPMKAEDIDIEFIFSKGGGLHESLSKQLRYGGNYVDFAKTIINLDKVINSAVLIEKHRDKYKGTSRENRNLEAVFVMVSAFRDGDYVIPVQLEIKKSSDVGGRLYLTVAMTKIEASVLEGTVDEDQAFPLIPASITYNVADIFKEINPQDGHFLKYLPDGFLSEAQKDAKRKAIEEDDARIASYKLPVGEDTSPRALLANAFEGIITNDIEKRRLEEYKGNMEMLYAEEEKLRELRAQIKELSFAKGPRDTKRIKELQFEANKTANRIAILDGILLRLEAAAPLQNILKREKEKAYKRGTQKVQKALEDYRDDRKKATLRNKIQGVVGELNQLLLNEDKKHHVPDSLKKAVADALALVNMDTVGAEERVAKYADLIAKEEAKAEPDQEKIDAYTATMENILRQGEKMGQRLKDLHDSYEEIQNSDDPDIANAYDPVIAESLKELSSSIGNTALRDMSTEQLQDVYDMYKMVLTRVRDANKSLIESIKEGISSRASKVVAEVRKAGGDHKHRASILDPVKSFFWNNAKPVYAMEHIGSATMTEAYNNVRKGEDTWAKDVTEARAYYLDKSKKYGYDSWDFDKKYTFESTSGLEFELTLEQIMALYAYSKRDQADKHLRLGGFVFDSNIERHEEITKDGKTRKSVLKYKVNTADAHQISPEILLKIIGTLDMVPGAKSFVDEMQDYLSAVMGAKGNEVTMKMYGVKLFKEKHYFPLKSAKQFLFEQNEVAGEVRIKNSGFTNKTKPEANNPIILNNFMDVWATHVNDMSMYHSFVLPLEDFNRIFNYNSPKQEGVPAVSVKGTIQNAYSPAAVSYVKQLITDLNGGARSDPRETFAKAMTAKFKKAKVFSSLSVAIQQPSAIGRAFALVDPKYFRPTKDGMNHNELWAEVKKYAPVAIIKEMGYFDTNIGKSTLDFIKAKEYSTFKEKAKALIPFIGDSNYRDEALSKLPALADELAWCAIWNAVKRETIAKHHDLSPRSEEFLRIAGERFTEVITKTQVYDSVLARSANMRSKSGLMSMVTAFMAEPTTTINMLEDAIRKGKQGNKGYAARAFASVMVSIILNNALVALVYDMRDDDEDETYAEKYMQSFVSNMIDDINPLTYYPFVKDAWSLLQGYDVDRSDMSLVSEVADSLKGLVKAYSSENGDVSGAWWDIAGSVANIGGIPMQNIRREILGVSNIFDTLSKDFKGRATTKGSMADTIEHAMKDRIPVLGWLPGETKSDKLYDAIMSGDTAYVNRLKGSYKDKDGKFSQTKYDMALRTALRENDPRIKEAALAEFNGNSVERMRITKEIEAERYFAQYEKNQVQSWVRGAINAEIIELEKKAKGNATEESTPKKYDDYTVEQYYRAVSTGKKADADTIYKYLVEDKEAEGYLRHEAEDAIATGFATQVGKDYMAGEISRSKTVQLLEDNTDKGETEVKKWDFELEHGFSWSERVRKYRLGKLSERDLVSAVMDIEGATRAEANEYIDFLDLEMANEDTDITADDAAGYFEHAKPAGISVDVYLTYKNKASKCESDKDSNGNSVSGSKKKKVLAVIDSLPLTDAQKDALYFANGWAESKLYEAPWH